MNSPILLPLAEEMRRVRDEQTVEVAVLSEKRRAKSWAEWDYYVMSGHEPCWTVIFG